MIKDKLNIVYVLDDSTEQHVLFKMCVQSLLKFNTVDRIIVVYYNMSKNDVNEVCNFIDTNIVSLSLIYFDIDQVDKVFPYLPNTCNDRLRYPSLMRWWLSKIIDVDYFWYIDTDIVFADEIRTKFLKIQNEKNRYFFAFNRKMYIREEVNGRYYRHTNQLNGGILYINAKAFNDNKMFEDIVKYYNDNAENIYYMNQDGYQYLFDNGCWYYRESGNEKFNKL